MTPDVNVLMAASRADHPHHGVARGWREESLGSSGTGAAFTLMPMVVASFLRLVTRAKLFVVPTPVEDAVAFIEARLATPGVDLAPMGPEWWKLRQLCLAKALRGNDIPGAWLSPAVAQVGEHLVTLDRDVRRLLASDQATLLVVASWPSGSNPFPCRASPQALRFQVHPGGARALVNFASPKTRGQASSSRTIA